MRAIATAPKDGSHVLIHFQEADRLVTSRSRWLAAQERWNGMCRGEIPLGWSDADESVDPFS